MYVHGFLILWAVVGSVSVPNEYTLDGLVDVEFAAKHETYDSTIVYAEGGGLIQSSTSHRVPRFGSLVSIARCGLDRWTWTYNSSSSACSIAADNCESAAFARLIISGLVGAVPNDDHQKPLNVRSISIDFKLPDSDDFHLLDPFTDPPLKSWSVDVRMFSLTADGSAFVPPPFCPRSPPGTGGAPTLTPPVLPRTRAPPHPPSSVGEPRTSTPPAGVTSYPSGEHTPTSTTVAAHLQDPTRRMELLLVIVGALAGLIVVVGIVYIWVFHPTV